MTTSKPNLVELAKQGDAGAITALMNRSLQSKGITAKATLNDGCLQVTLESDQLPNQQALAEFTLKGVIGLKAKAISKLRVCGCQRGSLIPTWNEEFNLEKPKSDATEIGKVLMDEESPNSRLDNSKVAQNLFDQGVAKSNGQNQEAIEDFSKVIKLFPNYAEAYFMRGSNHLALKNYQAAIEDFSKAISIKSDYGQAYYERGLARGALKDYRGAIEDYSKAILLNVDYDSVYNNRGAAYEATELYQDALKDFSQAISLNPKSELYYRNRAIVRKKLGDLQGFNSDSEMVKKLSTPETKQTAGFFGLFVIALILLSMLGMCSQNSPQTSNSSQDGGTSLSPQEVENLMCSQQVTNSSNPYYEDCKRKGY